VQRGLAAAVYGVIWVAIYGTPNICDLVYIAAYNGKIYAYTRTLGARWVYPREGYLQPLSAE
jgi:hypothetical protein